MDQLDKDLSKVFYSVDHFPSKDVNTLPHKETCRMCGCHAQAHAMYWQCPLLSGYICASCCQIEIPNEANLDQIKTKSICTSMSEVATICGGCKRNSLQA